MFKPGGSLGKDPVPEAAAHDGEHDDPEEEDDEESDEGSLAEML